MASPQEFTNAQLITQLSRTRKAFAKRYAGEIANVTEKTINYKIGQMAKREMVQEYQFSAARIFSASLEGVLRDIPDRTANATLKALTAVERATIGATEAERRDNKDLRRIAQKTAKTMNREILAAYLARFSGRSYRTGDKQRRSGQLESFLKSAKLAVADGHDVRVSLAPAVGNPKVPHIFRLNYGTESLRGSSKSGDRPPTFAVTLINGATATQRLSPQARRKGFEFPGARGRSFNYIVTLGAFGQVQLFANKNGIQGPRPSRGIAPSYFVEHGIANSADFMRGDYAQLIQLWKRRVARIRGTDGQLK